MATNLYLGSAASTGDMKNNVSKLLREIRHMKLKVEPDIQGWSLGSPASFLPLWHAALMLYSLPLANTIAAQGYKLYGKSDLRFLQGVYGVLRDLFQFQPRLPKEKFLRKGYAERKIILTLNILLLCQEKHKKILASTKKGRRTSSRYKMVSVCSTPGCNCPVLTSEDGLDSKASWNSNHYSQEYKEELKDMESSECRRLDINLLAQALCHDSVQNSVEDVERMACVVDDPLPDITTVSPEYSSSPNLTPPPSEINVEVIKHKTSASWLIPVTGQDREPTGPTEASGYRVEGSVEDKHISEPSSEADLSDGRGGVKSRTSRDDVMSHPALMGRENVPEVSEEVSEEVLGEEPTGGPPDSKTSESDDDPGRQQLKPPDSHSEQQQADCECRQEEGGVQGTQDKSRSGVEGESSHSLQLISSRVEELSKMMEQVMARCVLVETHVKLASLQKPQQLKQQPQQLDEELQQLKHEPHQLQQQLKQQPQQLEQLQQHSQQNHSTPVFEPVGRVTRLVPGMDGTGNSEEQFMETRVSVSTPVQFTKEERSMQARCDGGLTANGTMDSSLVLAREATTSLVTTPTTDLFTTPTTDLFTTPTTPTSEETEQIIKNLRSRAQRTRQFLRHVTSARPAMQQWE